MHCLNVHRTKHLEKVHNLILFGSLQTIAKMGGRFHSKCIMIVYFLLMMKYAHLFRLYQSS